MAGSWRAVSFTELCVIRAHQFVSGRMRSHCILSAAENTQCRTKCGVLFQTTLLDGKRSWHIFRTYRRFCLTLRKGGGGRLPILRNSCVLQDSSHNSEMFLAALVSMPFSFHYKLCQFIFLTSLISATYETHFLLFKKKKFIRLLLMATWLDNRRLLSDKGNFFVSHNVTNLYGPPRSQLLS